MTKFIENILLDSLGLDEDLKKEIISIILSHKPVNKIILFGSRSQVEYQETSDIDLAVVCDNWTSTDINIVLDKLEEYLPIALRFDLVHFNKLKNITLKQEIEKGLIIYDDKQN